MSADSLPLHDLVTTIGRPATLALIEAFGGTRVYVPVAPNQASPLVRSIGREAALALSARLGGSSATNVLKVPLARDWRILAYREEGLSYREIARRLAITEDTVWRHLQRAEQTARQGSLFD